MIDGVILAGGASRRFGADKCFAPWQGSTFLRHVADAVRPEVDALFVLARYRARVAAYEREAPGARVHTDPLPLAGPVEALRNAWPHLEGDLVVVVGCDAPGLVASTVRRLAATGREGPAMLITAQGALHSAFAMPREVLGERLAQARRLLDLVVGARLVEAAGPGLNLNRPV